MSLELPTSADVERAQERLAGVVHRTPLVPSRTLSELAGREVFLKLENWQRTGAFKLRGAYNRLAAFSPSERARGVVAASSGNHGQAVAWAAARLGLSAVIVMPEDAAEAKVEAAINYGAKVLRHGRGSVERTGLASEIATEEGRVLVSPYDDPYVIAGQGTIGREILDELPDVEAIVGPIGGGGLAAGLALLREQRPDIQVYGAEPTGACGMHRSLDAGKPVELEQIDTVADGLRVKSPGLHNFAICERYLSGVLVVTDEQIIDAMRLLMERVKVVVEPSGAVAVAACLASLPAGIKRVAAVITGGNVDLDRLARLLLEGTAGDRQ